MLKIQLHPEGWSFPKNFDMRIAVPIVSPTMDEALRDIDEAVKIADIIELRIDCMDSPCLEKLLTHSPIPKIVTNRPVDEGGRFNGSEKERINYLQEAIDLGAEYVDIEVKHYQQLDRKNTRLIVSYHNLEGTPNNLREIYYKIDEKNPDIIKIATMAKCCIDSLKMLSLIAGADKHIIGICMGKEGLITRIYGPAFGSYLTFASLSEEKSSAPGQITAKKLRQIWKDLKLL